MFSISCLAAAGSCYTERHHLRHQSCFYPYGVGLHKHIVEGDVQRFDGGGNMNKDS